MLDKIMDISLRNRLIVVLAALALLVTGSIISLRMPVDVFPDLTAPTVTILTEAHGFAPEEVEMQVTFPLETAVNGASGVRRVRSNSIQGLSTIWVEFDWGTEIYRARQIVNEKIQAIQYTLPEGVDQPTLAPVASLMGEIMVIGLTAETTSQMDLRSLADFSLRRRLLAVPGVAQVKVYGGEVKQFQVQVNPNYLKKYNLSLSDVLEAVRNSNINAAGGIFNASGQEYLIRGMGRIHNLAELEQTVITTRGNVPILVKDIGRVKIAAATKLGQASINKKDAVLLVISKQPDANTLELTRRLNDIIDEIRPTLAAGIAIHNEIFQQADFIETAVDNVITALRDGSILVVLILLLFLVNFRTVIISISAIPVSLIIALLCLKLLGLSVNTMTLGGLAIAIGILVDDAIIYIENVYRRLKENAGKSTAQQKPFFEVVQLASAEIRTPIVMATFIVVVVFLPLFYLSGVEGRMLRPLGIAYVVSVLASLLVAVTLTPALSSFLLRKISSEKSKDSWLVEHLKKIYEPVLEFTLKRTALVLSATFILIAIAVITFSFLGRSFLPEFNEGTFNISLATVPGTSLEESGNIGRMAEELLLDNPAITSVARRTGRTEMDEHSLGSHAHELEVQVDYGQTTREKILEQLRNKLALLPGTVFIIGQPISHRIDHMLSGTRANIAVKIFGDDLYKLRQTAERIKSEMADIEGIVDLSVDQQTDIPQVRLIANRQKMALYGLTAGDLDRLVDIAFLGVSASQIYEGQNRYELVVRYAPEYRQDLDAIRNSLIDTPSGSQIPLYLVCDIILEQGPNYISRENVQRKIVVQANVQERDLLGVVAEIREKVGSGISLDPGYYVEYGGQFESATEATRTITLLSMFSILAIFIALYMEFRSFRQSFLVMVNLPLALIGGVVAIFVTDGIITIASLVGFITLFGIAVRNGIIMVSHYNYLLDVDKKPLAEAVLQGSLERLSPILMTALTTGLALTPLAFAGNQPGSEIQAPLSIVILGGLLSATFLNMIVIPVLFKKWGVPKKIRSAE